MSKCRKCDETDPEQFTPSYQNLCKNCRMVMEFPEREADKETKKLGDLANKYWIPRIYFDKEE